MKTGTRKSVKGNVEATSEPAPHANIQALGTLLTNSYGKQSLTLASEEGPVFGVVRDALPEEIKKQWAGEILELWAGLDEDENVFACAFLDFETRGVEPRELAAALGEASRAMGRCYGSFGSLDDRHVTFVVGLPGSCGHAVPATMLADTIAHALDGAAAAKKPLARLAGAKKAGTAGDRGTGARRTRRGG